MWPFSNKHNFHTTEAANEAKVAATPDRATAEPQNEPRLVRVVNHPFPPRIAVGIYHRHEVEAERGIGREPTPAPLQTAVIDEAGGLVVAGLTTGLYFAVGETTRGWRYVAFPVRG